MPERGGCDFYRQATQMAPVGLCKRTPSVALESGGLRGGPGRARGARLGSKMSPRAVANPTSGGPDWASGSQTWCLRVQNYNRRSGVGATPPPIPKNQRSRGEAPPGPATRRPSKTLRWRHANVAPLKHGKAPSGRSPTKCGDEGNQHDGVIVARQCGPR